MSLITTYNGINIITLPCDVMPGVAYPSSVQWDIQEMVATSPESYTGETQVFDWMTSYWQGQVSLPPMYRDSADAWQAFIMQCRGQSNAFMFGDYKSALPKGKATGTPVVSGASQTGYNLVTRGWTPSITSILQVGDLIGIGYRMYKVLNSVNSDESGNATLAVWPNLRDLPADGTTIITRNVKGLFRLASNNGNKFSVNPGVTYGFSGFAIREAF